MWKGTWMNKAITDGVVFMPPAFSAGLDVWSSGDGTPGSDTYDNAANAAFVPADQDFSGCLEVQTITSTTKLRYMGETPMLPGCYLRVTARVKVVSGALPSVRIAGWAGGAGGSHVSGLLETGPSTTLTSYGEVVEVSAIIGSGQRTGVDMVWGSAPLYGHFGLDVVGSVGSIIRIDDLVIEDVTSVFLRDMMNWVDVRDFGAVGDGVSDDQPAFEAADDAANGRRVLVPAGTYYLADSMTFENHVEFEGTITMPDDKIFSPTKDYSISAYIDAFGSEELAFKKAFQALLNSAGHESLDLDGRRLSISSPIDMQAAVANRTSYAQRRHIHNGQLIAEGTTNWETTVVTSQASYNRSDAKRLTGVVDVANIPVGSLIEGNGVGREVYVRSKNVAAQEIELSAPFFDADGTQTFTFKRFKYILDFSGFEYMDKLVISNVEFQCSGVASAVLLSPSGLIYHFRDCFFTRPLDRGITSHGEGCQGMLIDRCQWLSNESGKLSQERQSIGFNTNGNDVKVRNNRAVHMRHFGVMGGSSSVITGNHWFQGDSAPAGTRMAGIVLTRTNCRATLTGNYVDNSFIEWANEHDPNPDYNSEFSFSGLNISGNTFLAGYVASWFGFIVIKPHGPGHFINGLNVSGNVFRILGGTKIDQVERVDTTYADLSYDQLSNITFSGNMFNAVKNPTFNPLTIRHEEQTLGQTWVVDCAPLLPFKGWAKMCEGLTFEGKIATSNNTSHHEVPYVKTKQGPNSDQLNLVWSRDVTGTVVLMVRMDNPLD